MKNWLHYLWLGLLALSLHAEPLKVGVVGYEPFVSYNDGVYSGLSIHYWKDVARILNLEYNFIPTDRSFNASVRAVHDGEFDVLVGPVSVTHSRYQLIDYSRPYFMNNVGMALLQQEPSFFDVLLSAFGSAALYLIGVFVVLLVIFSHLFYWAEKPWSERYQRGYCASIGDAFWATLSSFLRDVLYDPVSSLGRVILSVWLILSIVFMAAFTAVVTSTMTFVMTQSHSDIRSKADLIASSVAVREQSSTVGYAQRFGAVPVPFKTVDEAFRKLDKQHVSAVMGDYYALKLQVEQRNQQGKDYVMSGLNLRNDEFAFVLRKGSPLVKRIDEALLHMQDKDLIVDKICDKYLGPMNTQSCEF